MRVHVTDPGGFPGRALAAAFGSPSPSAEGCRAVVHALPRLDLTTTEPGQGPKVLDGVRAALEGARRAGVATFVLVGDAAVLCGGRPVAGAGEEAPLRPVGAHAIAAAEAERLVRAADGPDLRTTVLRPATLWGVGDDHFASEIEHAVRARHYLWIDGGRFVHSTCHARNLAEAARLAAASGPPGGVLHVTDGGPAITFRAFVTGLLEIRGLRAGRASLPHGLARLAAAGLEAGWTVTGRRRPPPITRSIVARWGSTFEISDDRARADLGYREVTTREEGLRELRALEGEISAGSR